MVNDTAQVRCVVRSRMTISIRYDTVLDGRTAIPSALWLLSSFCKTSLMAVAAIRAASSLISDFKKLPFLSRTFAQLQQIVQVLQNKLRVWSFLVQHQ